MNSRARAWIADIVVGGIVGGIVGAIVAINFVIFAGINDGYEATIAEVFRQNAIAGVVTLAILGFSPVCGVAVARRLRRKCERPGTD